jgi:hypothetical protein
VNLQTIDINGVSTLVDLNGEPVKVVEADPVTGIDMEVVYQSYVVQETNWTDTLRTVVGPAPVADQGQSE